MSIDKLVHDADPVGSTRDRAVRAPTWPRHFSEIRNGRHLRRRRRRTVRRAGSTALTSATVVAAFVVPWSVAPPSVGVLDRAVAVGSTSASTVRDCPFRSTDAPATPPAGGSGLAVETAT